MSRRVLHAVLYTALLAPALPAQGRPADPGLERLRTELESFGAIAQGTLGVGVIHLESGRELFVNGSTAFPMASTYKVPIATQLLRLVDQGKLRLEDMVTLKPSDLHPGSGTLTSLFDDPGVSLSYRNLLELMLLISDNSATDLNLKAAGGGAAVNARLAELGIRGISVDRPTILLIADAIGVKNLPPESEWTRQRFGELARGVSEADQAAARDAFYRDTRDTSTPEGMARLLAKIWRKEALSPAMTDLLLDVMYRCETGQARLKGVLPPWTRVAHKTGTLGLGVANDVGIIDLPDGAGHVVVAAFVKDAKGNTDAQERALAMAARAVYDYFTFNR
jgi:beta-lactamase class A